MTASRFPVERLRDHPVRIIPQAERSFRRHRLTRFRQKPKRQSETFAARGHLPVLENRRHCPANQVDLTSSP